MLFGDGATGFSLMDVDTLVRHKLPVVMVVGNNSAWGLEKGPMQMLYGYDVVADLAPESRYDEVVKALGGGGETVTDPRQIGPALDRAFACGCALPGQRDDRRRGGLPARHLRGLMSLVIRPAHDDELAAVGALTFDAYAADGFVGADSDYAEHLRDATARAREAELYVAVDEQGTLLGTVTYCPEGSPCAGGRRASARESSGCWPSPRTHGAAGWPRRWCGCAWSAPSSSATTRWCSADDEPDRPRTGSTSGSGSAATRSSDWRPTPEIELLAFRMDLTGPAAG